MEALAKPATDRYINRELSLLEFNKRVFAQAQDPSVPLLERLRFLCITSTNLDEFFEIRVAALKQRIEHDLDGMPAFPEPERLADNCFRRKVGDAHYIVIFSKDGTYESRLYRDAHLRQPVPEWTHSGRWRVQDDRFYWESNEEGTINDRILRLGRKGFVLDGKNNGIELWRWCMHKDSLEDYLGESL